MAALLRTLGGARVEVDGIPVRGRAAQRRRLALLALLATAPNQTLSRDRLAAFLWPDADADSARRILSEALYVLRKEFGEKAIASVGDELTLNSAIISTDVGEFRSALGVGDVSLAISLYSGPFLDGWYVAGAPEFERWAEEERQRLGRQYRDALSARASQDEASGNYSRAVESLRHLVCLDPFSTTYVASLARLLAARGERSEAIRVIGAHTERLRLDLDADADPQLTALAERLRKGGADNGSSGSEYQAPVTLLPISPHDAYAAAPVYPIARPTADALPAAPATPSPLSAVDPPRSARQRLVATVGSIAAIVLVAVGLVAGRANRATPEPAAEWNHLAVLYFDDDSPTHDLAYLADGLTEQLIDELSGSNAFHVVSRNGILPYRGREHTPSLDSIAHALHVGTLISGSVQRSRDSVLVTVGVVDVKTGEQLESRIIERPVAELFSLERDLSHAVAALLRKRLGREVTLRVVANGTSNLRARELRLRAERELSDADALAMRPAPEDVLASLAALRRADSLLVMTEQEDPQWIEPFIARGWVAYKIAETRTGRDQSAGLDRALTLADDAVRRDPDGAAALQLRGTVRYAQVTALDGGATDSIRMRLAENDLRASLALDSTRASGWATLSYLLWLKGSFAEAALTAERALREDAFLDGAQEVYQALFYAHLMLGEYAESRDWCARGRATFGSDHRFVLCELTVMRHDTTRPPDATRAWSLVRQLDDLETREKTHISGHPYDPIYRRMVAATVSARAGQRDVARATLAQSYRETASDSSLRLDLAYDEAALLLALGEPSRARDAIARLVSARPVLRPMLERDPLIGSVATPLP